MRRLLPVLVSLAGCGGSSLPTPAVREVTPRTRAASASGPVTVLVDAVLPTVANYGAESAVVDGRLAVSIGPRAFGSGRWVDGGVVTGFLGSVLPEGRYDVTVELGDGRAASAPGGFTVTAGTWPDGYLVDPLPAQRAGVPFNVTLRARGDAAEGFSGTVYLSVDSGDVSPPVSGPFDGGVRVETVTVQKPGRRTLTVTDLAGHSGASDPFTVR